MEQPKDRIVIDQNALDSIRALRQEGAPDPLRKILSTYLDTTPALLTTLQDSASAGDCDSVMQIAHSVKSSSASVGALTLSETCRRLELQATEGNAEGLEALAQQARKEFDGTETALRLEMDR